jgi:Rod binding domain-containing protein
MNPIHLNSPIAGFPTDAANPGGPKQAASAHPTATDSATRSKVQKAAQDFEALMISTLWKSMREESNESGEEQDAANQTLGDWGMSVAANSLAKWGGLGIGKMIIHSLTPKVGLEPAK